MTHGRQPRALAECVDPLHPARMASPIVISIPHQLGRAEARRRIEGGFANIIHLLPGYLATRSERAGAPVLIWPALVATAMSAIVVSSVSPERCEVMVV